ncbi:relaxase/mobilization nuclease domain-containing protein [Prevotella sp. kh1p2]|uniref:relaxase/mobilization nuclease domain-containing protein n=1 Tax=Prevotella sp. kh1p2 TaxID=1761883 RepID=UPI0008B2197D|nr:relaxase/mobilization nuclease domain-containing protein [Prevotella sp. kh1p2]SES97085.1 Relaxase/Mobilisation nuclease domain-containing protein [Prevotella sp. kh1p2]SET04179.1 Relaxase/Mobilisation nuclease domain-containing protein [Prevotella sp. kh1p2]SNU11370.1 Relaxase/Mobilisation nuclease domain-containing protein [Prevotellaceae bacterium KH2P17]
MIGKCKAIAHGSTALDYIFREGKLGQHLVSNHLYGTTPKEIYGEMKMVSDYNTRCRNKFLRIEIGIAPTDEKRLSLESVRNLASNFTRQMGLENHQWVAVTHKDTDNMHIHIIANRISLYGEVYDTTFVSNRAARVAEELSRKYGMTIAKEVKAKKQHQEPKANPTREQTKKEMRQICYNLLNKYKGTDITGHSMFLYELNKNGVAIERMRNRQGKVYGLKFSYEGQSFKASEIGREFGYRSLQKNFEPINKEESNKSYQTIQEVTEKKEQSDTGYQLVPKSRSSISRDNDTSQVQNPIGAVADTIVGAADEVVEGLGDLITPTAQGDDYAEVAWQRKLRNQANRKKRRGRRL